MISADSLVCVWRRFSNIGRFSLNSAQGVEKFRGRRSITPRNEPTHGAQNHPDKFDVKVIR